MTQCTINQDIMLRMAAYADASRSDFFFDSLAHSPLIKRAELSRMNAEAEMKEI